MLLEMAKMRRWLGMKAETKTELMEGWSSKGVHEELLLERLEVKGLMRLQE